MKSLNFIKCNNNPNAVLFRIGIWRLNWIEKLSKRRTFATWQNRNDCIWNWVSDHVTWQWGTWVLVQLLCGEAGEGFEEIWEEGPHDSWVMHSQTQLMFLSDTWLELYGAMAKTPQITHQMSPLTKKGPPPPPIIFIIGS